MSAADQIPTLYFRAKQLIPTLPPLRVGPDLAPGSADAEAKLEPRTVDGSALISVRSDFPSSFLTPAQQAVEIENTLNHEGGHPWDTLLTLQGRNHHVLYWNDLRKFPGTWEQAQAAADAMGLAGWQYQPRESWAECFGAAMSGRWTKPEKTMNWGKTVDVLAARAFFQGLAGVVAQPVSVPPLTAHTIEWLGPVPTTNYYQGRDGNPIAMIVDHWMAAAFDSALAHFMSPAAQVSAHYLISQQGRIVQVVDENDTAYHAGSFSVNQFSIGIEHEASPTVIPSDALYAASAWLHAQLADRYGLTLEYGVTVRPHNAIVPTQCPGTLDLMRIITEAEDDMFTTDDRAKLDRLVALANAEGPRIWTQRLQDWLSKLLHSLPIFAAGDYTGPDVTTGQPRK